MLPRARLAALLEDDGLRAEGEEQVFDALVAWHNAQAPPPDEADLAGLLSLVRFPLMRAEHVREVVMASPLMGSMAAKDCLTKALLAGYQALDQQLAAARPRKVRAGIGVLLIGGMLSDHLGYHPPLDLTERLLRNSCGGGEWEATRSLLEARAGAAAATLGGRLHVAGGTGASQAPLASVESYDAYTDRWLACAPMGAARALAAAAVVGGKWYVLGGQGADGELLQPRPQP